MGVYTYRARRMCRRARCAVPVGLFIFGGIWILIYASMLLPIPIQLTFALALLGFGCYHAITDPDVSAVAP